MRGRYEDSGCKPCAFSLQKLVENRKRLQGLGVLKHSCVDKQLSDLETVHRTDHCCLGFSAEAQAEVLPPSHGLSCVWSLQCLPLNLSSGGPFSGLAI